MRIVGIDEADLARGEVSWLSPIAKALLKAKVGDLVQVRTPAGLEEIEVVAISYDGRRLSVRRRHSRGGSNCSGPQAQALALGGLFQRPVIRFLVAPRQRPALAHHMGVHVDVVDQEAGGVDAAALVLPALQTAQPEAADALGQRPAGFLRAIIGAAVARAGLAGPGRGEPCRRMTVRRSQGFPIDDPRRAGDFGGAGRGGQHHRCHNKTETAARCHVRSTPDVILGV